MMKNYISFLLFFCFACIQAQERDLCKEFLNKERIEFENFKKVQSKTKFIDLRDKIFTDIKTNKEVLTDNIHLCIVSNTFINDYYPSGSKYDCNYKSTLYLDKKSYLDSIFWVKETFIFVKKNFKKNIFPVINHNGSFHLTKKNFSDIFSDNEYSFIKNFSIITLSEKKEEVFYLPNKKSKLSVGFTSVLVTFKDHELVNKVEVRIINIKGIKPNIIEKKYEYTNNQWKLIETNKN